jgi:hypothetical protein
MFLRSSLARIAPIGFAEVTDRGPPLLVADLGGMRSRITGTLLP